MMPVMAETDFYYNSRSDKWIGKEKKLQLPYYPNEQLMKTFCHW
jgi:hypothetical protein